MSTRAQGERALDMLGATNNELLELLGSMVGLTIGEKEANIFYIQDSGQKKVGRCYIDNTNMKLYRCIAATTSTSNTTANFTEINLLNHSDRLDNLVRVSELIYVNNNSEELKSDLNYNYNSNSCNASDGTIFIILFKHKSSNDYVQHILLKETRVHSIQVLGFSSNPMQLDLSDTYFRFFEGSIPQSFILYKIYKIKN